MAQELLDKGYKDAAAVRDRMVGVRNHAAHGKYDPYDASQVAVMLQGVTDFLIRLPA